MENPMPTMTRRLSLILPLVALMPVYGEHTRARSKPAGLSRFK